MGSRHFWIDGTDFANRAAAEEARLDRAEREAYSEQADQPSELVIINGQSIDFDAVRNLMDDEICEAIHGTVDTEQEFVDAYLVAHEQKFGAPFIFN